MAKELKNNLYRRSIVDDIIPFARKDKKIIVLVCDMGFGVCDAFKKEFPDRLINMGIMEQATVGIAAGLAMAGYKPVVYSIVNFLVYRALEQVRNDVVMQDLNVKFISTGANNYFHKLGYSHCCGEDDKKLMDMIGLKVYDPYLTDEKGYKKMVKQWITSHKAGYIRV